jgi:hypothetical protein
MKTTNRQARITLLGGSVSLIAMTALLGASPAHATTLAATDTYATNTAVGFITAGTPQSNLGATIAATVNGAIVNNTVANSPTTSTSGIASTTSVSDTTLAAYATGNSSFPNPVTNPNGTVDLATIGTATPSGQTGIAVLTTQSNGQNTVTPIVDTTINSSVSGSSITNSTTNAVNGDTPTLTNNLITAQTTGNSAVSSVTGELPSGYTTSPVAGAANSSGASGNVVVATNQTNTGIQSGVAGSLAVVSGNTDSVLVNTSAAGATQTLNVATAQTGNTLSAAFTGNSGSNIINVQPGGAPTLDGSLVVADTQANNPSGAAVAAGANNTNSTVSTIISGGGVDQPILLSGGSTTQSGNVISSSATGNSTGTAGNLITLGINLNGTTASQINNAIYGSAPSVGADLALSNAQYNSNLNLASNTTGGDISTVVQGAAGAGITLANNAITSTTTGNGAVNAINTTVGDAVNLISGLVALGSNQYQPLSGVFASTTGNSIAATVGDNTATTPLGVTNSTVALTNNSLSATATDNNVTNGINLAASTINLGVAGAPGGAATTFDPPGIGSVSAGASLVNNQSGATFAANATLGGNNVTATLTGPGVTSDTANLTNTALAATSTSNNANNTLSLAGSAAVTGSAGLLNMQDGSPSNASATNNTVALDYLGTAGASLTGDTGLLTNTSIGAIATGNSGSSLLAVSGGSLTDAIGSTSNGLGSAANPFSPASTANADLALNSVQGQSSGSVTATNSGSQIVLNANAGTGGSVSSPSFTVSGPASPNPTIQALAFGNTVANVLSAVANTTLGDSAGLLNTQASGNITSATLSNALVAANVNTNAGTGDVSGSTITVDSNLLRALTYSNQASNTLTASADTLNLASLNAFSGANIPLAAPSATDGTTTGVGATYALLNDQQSGVLSTATVGDVTNPVTVGAFIGNAGANPTVTNVTASTTGNTLVASAFGNQANNTGNVQATNLTAVTFSTVADVTNVQGSIGSIGASVVEPRGANTFTTQVLGTGLVSGSTLGVSGNAVLTQAEGNVANSSLNVSGTGITDTSATPLAGLVTNATDASAPLAFDVTNVQNGAAALTVGQTLTNALLSVGGDVSASTLLADTNQFTASATNNLATNALTYSGASGAPLTTLNASGGVQNVQNSTAALDVTLGAPGSAGTSPITVSGVTYSAATGNDYGNITGNTLTVNGSSLVFDVSGLTGPQLSAFENLFSNGGTLTGTTYTLAGGGATYTLTDPSVVSGLGVYNSANGSISNSPIGTLVLGGTPATPASPSVVIATGGAITNSILGVNNNQFKATAVANNATNTNTVNAGTVSGGAGIAAGTAGATVNGAVTTALADYAVSNVQTLGNSVAANAYGETAINPTATGALISGSTLSVSNNTQAATAQGNEAVNTLSLAATDTGTVAPTGALVSNQSATFGVTASAGTGTGALGQIVTAPGAMSASTLTMSGNSTSALAIVNNATNTVTADATNLNTANTTTTNATASVLTSPSALADYALNNVQSASGATSTATVATQMVNSDSTSTTTAGLVNSAVTLSGNSTSADAVSNLASNTLNLGGTNSTATGAVTNSQTNSDGVSATGLTEVGFALNGGSTTTTPASTGSTVSVTGNSLNMQAVGNQSSNVLNVGVSSNYSPTQLAASSAPKTASATYAVLNSQNNSGAVSASAPTGTTFGAALNGGTGGTAPVVGSTVTVSYNTVGVSAFGNSASNSLVVPALNSGNATAALQNSQINNGAVTASVVGATIGSQIGGPGVSGSTVAVGGNSISATAIGNAANSSIVH